MKIHLDDDLEKEDEFDLKKVGLKGAINTQPPILVKANISQDTINKDAPVVEVKQKESSQEQEKESDDRHVSIPANSIHHNMASGNQENINVESKESDQSQPIVPSANHQDKDLVEVEEKNILPSIETKEEAIIPVKKDILLATNDEEKEITSKHEESMPAITDKETTVGEVSVAGPEEDQEVEDVLDNSKVTEANKAKPKEEDLRVGATIAKKGEISSFRNELLKDLNMSDGSAIKPEAVDSDGTLEEKQVDKKPEDKMPEEKSAVLASDTKPEPVTEEKKDMPVGELTPEGKQVVVNKIEVKAEPGSKEVANNVENPESLKTDNSVPIQKGEQPMQAANNTVPTEKPSSLNPNWTDPLDSGPKIEKASQNASAIMIESTVTPQEEKQIKGKKAINTIVTILVILAMLAAGYIWGWPILQEIIGG